MEAKDTVMSEEQWRKSWAEGRYNGKGDKGSNSAILEAQSEISFKAGINKVIDWGEETCYELDHPYSSRAKGEAYNRKRHRCPKCWQSLKLSLVVPLQG